jgi:hypothetical protein
MEDVYRSRRYQHGIGAAAGMAAPLAAGRTYRFVLGRDASPSEIEPSALPDDAFAAFVLKRDRRPQSLTALLADLDADRPYARSFVVGDGSQIAWTAETKAVERALRLLIVRGASAGTFDLMVSAPPAPDSTTDFLQVIAWDERSGAHQFYDRRDSAWIWAGSSWDALAPESRGKGPFDSHVNGGLNMKELKAPWLHWHSQSARIEDDVLAPDDPLRAHPIWRERAPANELEIQIVRPWIERWTATRLERRTEGGRLHRVGELFRQVVDTTTVNIVSSPQESAVVDAGAGLFLPLSFLIDRDALIDTLELAPDIAPPVVDGAVYAKTMADFGVHLADRTARFPGDTHFAFAVPERAFEDLTVVREMIAREILSPRLAAALLMVDFANPIFSDRRARLARYAPEFAIAGDAVGLEAALVRAIRTGGTPLAGSPEAELLDNLALSESAWRREYERRIEALFTALAPRWQDPAGFAEIFRLAESRRRKFRGRKLSEFALTLARSTASDDPFLELTPDGTVRPQT